MSSRPANTPRGSSGPYAPYQRPSRVQQPTQWAHDLFGPNSNRSSPALGQVQANLPSSQVGPSEASRSVNNSASRTHNPRFGIKGGSSAAVRAVADAAGDRQRTQAQVAADREQGRIANLERQRQRQIEQDKKARDLLDEQHAVQTAVATAEQYGFTVSISNLVYGTSAEDVKTAFGQYGATTFCYIANEATAKEGDQLIARLTFERHADAAEACAKLNGAVADGRPLIVELTERTPFPAPLPPVLTILSGTTIRGSTPTGPRASRPTALPIPSKMYADEVSMSDSSMQIDQAASVVRGSGPPPSAPRAMLSTSARGGKSGGRGGATGGRPAPVPSLSARLGIITAPVQRQPQGHLANGHGAGRGQVPTGPRGNNIFSRVGSAPANGARGGKGQKAGGSLLARLQ